MSDGAGYFLAEDNTLTRSQCVKASAAHEQVIAALEQRWVACGAWPAVLDMEVFVHGLVRDEFSDELSAGEIAENVLARIGYPVN